MSDNMDVNCGDFITGDVSLETKDREIFELFLRVASAPPSSCPGRWWRGDVMLPPLSRDVM